jgi:hypothetical protein
MLKIVIQGIFDKPSLDIPSHLSSVNDYRDQDTLEYFYMYFTLTSVNLTSDIGHYFKNRYNTLHVFFV